MTAIRGYVRVRSVAEALSELGREGERRRVLAGGTDLLPQALRRGASAMTLVDVSDVEELRTIIEGDVYLRIGAAARLDQIARAPELVGGWAALSHAAALVGSPQIRGLATLGGNLSNASPSADTAPVLLALDAEVVIASGTGERQLPLADFFVGPGRSILKPGELLTAVLLPRIWRAGTARYLKHAPRRAMDLAVVGVAASYGDRGGRPELRIALGAVAPTPMRARAAEALLSAAPVLDEAVTRRAAACAAREAAPISDVRASAEYRRYMIEALVVRALRAVLPAEQ